MPSPDSVLADVTGPSDSKPDDMLASRRAPANKELLLSLQQLVAVQRDELKKMKATAQQLSEAQRQVRLLEARTSKAEHERNAVQRRYESMRDVKEGLARKLETIEAQHEAELRAQLERLRPALQEHSMLIDTQQWLHESAEAERDAALAEELRLQQRAYDRKVAEIAAQWEGRLAEVSASRDDAQASVEFLRERARQLEALLHDSAQPIPGDLVRDLEHDLVSETQPHGDAHGGASTPEPGTLSHRAPPEQAGPDGRCSAHTSDSSSASEARQPPGAPYPVNFVTKAPHAANELFNPANELCALLAAVLGARGGSWLVDAAGATHGATPRSVVSLPSHCNEALRSGGDGVVGGLVDGSRDDTRWVAITEAIAEELASAEGAIFSPIILPHAVPPSLPLPPPASAAARPVRMLEL